MRTIVISLSVIVIVALVVVSFPSNLQAATTTSDAHQMLQKVLNQETIAKCELREKDRHNQQAVYSYSVFISEDGEMNCQTPKPAEKINTLTCSIAFQGKEHLSTWCSLVSSSLISKPLDYGRKFFKELPQSWDEWFIFNCSTKKEERYLSDYGNSFLYEAGFSTGLTQEGNLRKAFYSIAPSSLASSKVWLQFYYVVIPKSSLFEERKESVEKVESALKPDNLFRTPWVETCAGLT